MQQAEIAKTLIERDPDLAAPEKRVALFEAVHAIYVRDRDDEFIPF